ncbi:MAG: type II secretion system F family protein [Halomonadaceae bacterium]|nr:MAG: type II secretion system F family protein [Halomonadaceae bacterium]
MMISSDLMLMMGLAAIVVGGAAVAYLWASDHRRVIARKRLRAGLGGGNQTAVGPTHSLWLARFDPSWLSKLSEDPLLRPLLVRAGWRDPQAVSAFRGVQNIMTLAALIAVVAYWLLQGADSEQWFQPMLLSFTAVALAYLSPKLLLRRIASQHQQRIRDEIPVFVHLLKVLFDAGLSFDQALLTIARENRQIIPTIAVAIDTVMRQIKAGADRSEALSAMAADLDVGDFTDLIRLLRQIERFGGDIQQPLMEFAQVIEERRRSGIQDRVGKLSSAMTVVMVLFFLPALMLLLAGPGFISILESLGAVE